MACSVVILAAGRGSRMQSDLPKVLHPIGGVPMLGRLVETARSLNPHSISIVYHNHLDQIQAALPQLKNNVDWVYQDQLLGTGHAVSAAMQANAQIQAGKVLVLLGDAPLICADTIERLIKQTPNEGIGLLLAKRPDPTGLGRVVYNNGHIVRIVEEVDANEEEKAIQDIWTGVLCAPADKLAGWLSKLDNNNAQNEFYLPGILPQALAEGAPVLGVYEPDWQTTQGINTRNQLAQAERFFQQKQAEKLIAKGLTLADPARFDLRGELNVGQDVFIDINAVIEGVVSIGHSTQIGPNVQLRNVQIGANVTIKGFCVIENAVIEAGCTIGPFAHLRPGSHLKSGAKIGNFVEVKNTTLGKNSKANHLSYLGDATIGENVNIGAGTITCNYDGKKKHPTTIEDGAFIGSGTELIAPVTIGKNALIGAGSTITTNAPADQLTLRRAKQRSINYREPTSV